MALLADIARGEDPFQVIYPTLEKEWLGELAVPSWLKFEFFSERVEATLQHQLKVRVTTRTRRQTLPTDTLKSVSSFEIAGRSCEVRKWVDRTRVQLSDNRVVAQCLTQCFEALREKLTENEDPRLFWRPDIRGPLPFVPLFDPPGEDFWDRSAGGAQCPLCSEAIGGAKNGPVWAGRTLLWVHQECANGVWSGA